MTGYASVEGQSEQARWTWEIRAVNGRGLDIRFRLAEPADGLEQTLRGQIQKEVSRGNVTLSLRLQRDDSSASGVLNSDALSAVLEHLSRIESDAAAAGLRMRETSAAEILTMRGVVEAGSMETDADALRSAINASFAPLLAEFDAAREREGAALEAVLTEQVDEIARHVAEARGLLEARSDQMAESFRNAAARLRDGGSGLDDARIAQEMAVLAIKADVVEELDRLDAHIAAARGLLTGPGPKGRKLDFLTQEFNREANTLCSKAQFAELTRIGLDLKHVIDQMREQVQNVE